MGQFLSKKVKTTNAVETRRDDEEVNTAIAGMEEHAISMEQSHSTVFEITNAGETISDDKENEYTERETEAVTYLEDRLKNAAQQENKSRNVSCPKVPPILRTDERSKEYYDPKIVSFGPYHHGKPELQAVETIKTKVMQEFIRKHEKSIEDLYIKVLKLSEHARSCYVDGSTGSYTDKEFALMMLQDGCFILDLFHNKQFVSKHLDVFKLEYSLLDTILLENQIPFRVLNVLMSNIYKENEGLEIVTSRLNVRHWGIILEQDRPNKAKEQDTPNKAEEPVHLLALQTTLISKLGGLEKINQENLDYISCLPSFGSISDLHAKGIKFKPSNSISLHPAKKEIQKSISLLDVKFRSGFFTGELILPPLFLTPDALVYYTNLIAFEMCAPYIDATVTSYISFMNSLIANPEDVKVLRSKRIILHTLNSDKEAFKMLKEISSTKWRPVDVLIYQGVRQEIEKHYNSKKRIWIAVIRHKYFSQPWSVFGLLAALVAIILSFLQTFYTIHHRKG